MRGEREEIGRDGEGEREEIEEEGIERGEICGRSYAIYTFVRCVRL